MDAGELIDPNNLSRKSSKENNHMAQMVSRRLYFLHYAAQLAHSSQVKLEWLTGLPFLDPLQLLEV